MDTRNIVTIIIRNKAGQFFVHQRKATKKTFPNLYGLGAGGHIQENETPEAAAKRELLEETGLIGDLKSLFSFSYGEDNPYEIFVHEFRTDKEVRTDPGEWQWSGWLTKEQVDELLESNKLCPDTAQFYQQYAAIS